MQERTYLPFTEISTQVPEAGHLSRRRSSLGVAIASVVGIAVSGCSAPPQPPPGWKTTHTNTQTAELPETGPTTTPASRSKSDVVMAPGNRYLGIDTSEYNNPLDAQKLRADGFGFWIARAAIGLRDDTAFLTSAASADKANMLFGAYCVPLHDGTDIIQQADHCVAQADKSTPKIPGVGPRLIMADIEKISENPEKTPTKEDVYKYVGRIHERVPDRKTIVYTLSADWGSKVAPGRYGNPKLPADSVLCWASNQFTTEKEMEYREIMDQNHQLGIEDKAPVPKKPLNAKTDFMKGDAWKVANFVARPVISGYSAADRFHIYQTGQVPHYTIRQFSTRTIVQGQRIDTEITFPTDWDNFLKLAGVNESTNIPEPKRHL